MSDPAKPTAWQAGLDRAQRAVSQSAVPPTPPSPPAPPSLPPFQATGNPWMDRRMMRRWSREQRKLLKEQRQALEESRASPLEGWIMLAAAAGLAGMALLHASEMWWLLFPAMGIGTGGARIIGRRSAAAPVPLPAPPQTEATPAAALPARTSAPTAAADPRDARVDQVCQKILQEVERGGAVVTDLIRNPKETVTTLRATCRELTRRERDLLALSTPDDDARLAAERKSMADRIAAETDAVVKQRLASALAAIDDQRKQRDEITLAAKRFDAEHTRITYALESLYTQIIRVRSADSASVDVAGAGLRNSLDELGAHMNAVAEALEAVNRGDLTPVSPVTSESADAAADPGKIAVR